MIDPVGDPCEYLRIILYRIDKVVDGENLGQIVDDLFLPILPKYTDPLSRPPVDLKPGIGENEHHLLPSGHTVSADRQVGKNTVFEANADNTIDIHSGPSAIDQRVHSLRWGLRRPEKAVDNVSPAVIGLSAA